MADAFSNCVSVFMQKTRSYVSDLSDRYHSAAPKPPDGQSLNAANLEHLLRGSVAHLQAMDTLVDRHDAPGLLKHFDALRDAISLLPGNPYILDFLADLLKQAAPQDCEALRMLCEGVRLWHISEARLSKREIQWHLREGSDQFVHLTVLVFPVVSVHPNASVFVFEMASCVCGSRLMNAWR